MESAKHAGSCFVTLTYNQEAIPSGATLVPKDSQDWLKRLRLAIEPVRVRYYLVGEYGDESDRPHYHAALFGLSDVDAGGVDGTGGVVQSTWKMGHTYVGELTKESAAYIGGYVTKKMTRKDDGRLNGRYPEFARMSLRPGIGAPAIADVARVCRDGYGRVEVDALLDVPSSLLYGRARMPLGRYLRRVLRKELGRAPDAPFESYKKYALEMRVLLEDYAKTSRSPSKSLGGLYIDMNRQKCLNLEAKAKIFAAGRPL